MARSTRHRQLYGMGQGIRSRAAPGEPITKPCPICGAQPGVSCFKLSSWVVPAIPLKGFFTAKQKKFHPERAEVMSIDETVRRVRAVPAGRASFDDPGYGRRPTGPGPYGQDDGPTMGSDLRDRATALIYAKMVPAKRKAAVAFLYRPGRTPAQIQALITRLEPLPDYETPTNPEE